MLILAMAFSDSCHIVQKSLVLTEAERLKQKRMQWCSHGRIRDDLIFFFNISLPAVRAMFPLVESCDILAYLDMVIGIGSHP